MKQEVIRKYGVSPHKIEVIYNGVDIDKLARLNKENFVRQKHHISEKIIIGYVGTFYTWQGVEYVAKYFSQDKKDAV